MNQKLSIGSMAINNVMPQFCVDGKVQDSAIILLRADETMAARALAYHLAKTINDMVGQTRLEFLAYAVGHRPEDLHQFPKDCYGGIKLEGVEMAGARRTYDYLMELSKQGHMVYVYVAERDVDVFMETYTAYEEIDNIVFFVENPLSKDPLPIYSMYVEAAKAGSKCKDRDVYRIRYPDQPDGDRLYERMVFHESERFLTLPELITMNTYDLVTSLIDQCAKTDPSVDPLASIEEFSEYDFAPTNCRAVSFDFEHSIQNSTPILDFALGFILGTSTVSNIGMATRFNDESKENNPYLTVLGSFEEFVSVSHLDMVTNELARIKKEGLPDPVFSFDIVITYGVEWWHFCTSNAVLEFMSSDPTGINYSFRLDKLNLVRGVVSPGPVQLF